MPDIIKICIYTAASFITLFIFSKCLGKKQISQLDFVDYVIGISIGSIAATMATNTTEPFYYFIIAMAGFFVLDLFVNYIAKKGAFMKRLFKGKPLVIMYEGKINYHNLKKSRLDMNDFLSLCRQMCYFDIKDIYYALFESSGNISIIPKGDQRPTVVKDLSIPFDPPSIPNHLICDGKISHSGLSELNKDQKWLFNKLGIKSKKELKCIIYAVYDDKTDEIDVHYK